MEKISHIMKTYFIRRNVIDAEKSSVYQYGFQIGLEVCLNTVISILIAMLCHMQWETVIFFLVFILLRSYAGGLHLNSYISCMLCSCISHFALLMLVKYLEINNLLSLVITFGTLLLIKLLSPVQDINRPITPEEIKKFGKKLNYSIIGIEVLSIIFYCCQLGKMLLMIAVTTSFMVVILVLGKIKYIKCMRKVTE